MKLRYICRLSIAACLLFVSFASRAQQPLQAPRQTLHGSVRQAVLSGKAAPAGLLPASQRMNLSIVLPVRNQAALSGLLGRLYDPSSPDYHHFLSAAEFTEQFSPTAADYQAVVSYAQANGFAVGPAPANRMVVPISGSAAQVEKAFNVKMGLFHHPTENRLFYSPDREPSLNLSVPVAHVVGLNNFSSPRPMFARHSAVQEAANLATTGSGPGGSFLASDMRAAYYGGTALTGAGQTVGLLEFDGYNQSDVDLTFTSAGQTSSVPVENVLLDGATGASISGDDSEEVIDIVSTIGMAPGLSQVRVYIGSNDADILNAIASEDVAGEVSISWSWSPDDPATDDIFFEECAAQGQSVVTSSGDWGEFDPYFDNFYPAEDAFVTAAGGTDLNTDGDTQAWVSETAWDRSGGGISPDGIPIPAWQAGVATSTNGGSAALRNVPDVAAEAETDNYICNMGTCAGNYGGTSFSAPRWAGFLALVNQQAAAAGAPPVGFINPALYAIGEGSSYASSFHDIVSGDNDARGNCCGWPYYNAIPGYDLVTGWGSPSGQGLIDALTPAAPEGFALSSSAGTVTINPGGSGTTTIKVTDQAGFSGSVNLSVSGLPSGVTATWSTNPASVKSVLKLTVGASAVRGSYLLTVTGVSGAIVESTSFALAVNAPGFSLIPSPSNLKIYPGTSGSISVLVSGVGGFNSSVNLAVTSGLPAGVTASWVSNPTTGASSLTLTASDSASANSDAVVTITGSSGNQTESATLALIISPPLFYLNIVPYPSTIAQGSTVTVSVSAIPVDKFTDTIKLSAPELPPGVTASFNPASIAFGQTSVLTLTASGSAPVGTAMAGIEANGSYSGTINQFNLTVTAKAAPSFTIGLAQSSLTVVQGTFGTDGVTVTPQNGFTGKVNLAITSALPGGVSATFAPSSTAGSSQLTVSASSAATAGFYTLWITGTSGTQSTTASIFLTVNPPPSFSLSVSPGSSNLVQGSTTTDTVTVMPQSGFTGTVKLAVTSGLPSGVSASFSPNSTTGTSTLTLGASYSVPAGTYPMTIAGSSGGRTVTTTIPLNVAAAVTVPTSTVLTITPSGGTLTAGSPFTLTATVSPSGGAAMPTGNVVFTIGSVSPVAVLSSSGVATYSGTAPATPGNLTLSALYQGTTGFASSNSNTLNETVAAAAPASFALATTSVTVAAGATTANASTVSITPAGGFTGTVTLTASIASAPVGAKHLPTLSFGASSPAKVNSNGSAIATLTISTTAPTTATASPARSLFPWYPSGGAALACILLFGIPRRRRSWRLFLGMAALFLVMAGGLVACGGNLTPASTSSTNGTTPGLYTITVTGASGATTATASVALTVE